MVDLGELFGSQNAEINTIYLILLSMCLARVQTRYCACILNQLFTLLLLLLLYIYICATVVQNRYFYVLII